MSKSETKLIYCASLGCAKNLVDSQVMLGKLSESNYSITDDPNLAHVILVNTCSFIGPAKEESVQTVLEMTDYKESGVCEVIVVAGCLTQRYPEELYKEFPEVDLFIGTGEYGRIVEYLAAFYKDKKRSTYTKDMVYIPTEDDARINTSPSHTAFLKVSEGCNRNCAFCIIPTLRGKMRSRTVESLIQEAKGLVKGGAKELNIISQDLSLYGRDIKGENTLLNLLRGLDSIEGLSWIRLLYHYPDDLTDEVIAFMRDSKRVVPYLDIPVQHFSSELLYKMNRKISGEEIVKRLSRLRQEIPNIVLRTSVIVGFPGETEEDFQKLIEGIEHVRFDHLGAFAYSKEEGTAAFNLPNQVNKRTIERRLKEVYEVQGLIASSINEKYLGQTVEVICEGTHEDSDLLLVGRHKGQAPEIDGIVMINDTNGLELKVGDLVKVKISEVVGLDLLGEAISFLHA